MGLPYVVLSVAVSVDGYIDDAGDDRLLLSNDADFDRVDQLRADCDAILIGADTLRKDNPRLLVNSPQRRAARLAAGKPEFPVKITLTASGDLSRDLNVWHHGGAKLVYTTDIGAAHLREQLDDLAQVISLGPTISFTDLLTDLAARGIETVMVEGGTRVHTEFLAADLADELHVAIAPLLIGSAEAPRFLNPADYPGGSDRRMRLADVRRLGDVAVLRYLPKETGE